MRRHVFREPENPRQALFQQYTLPSRVSISQPPPEIPLITYTFLYHGGIISPIKEIDCLELSLFRPLFILKEGLLGCSHYGNNDTCNFSEDMMVERFNIFPEHLLNSDAYRSNRVTCCENQDTVFILQGMILLSTLIREHIIPYHSRHFFEYGIQIRCGMCSNMENDVLEYLLWESKIYHQLTQNDLAGYNHLLTHYQKTKSFLPGNVERLLFVLSQFNHLFSANVSSFSIQVQKVQKCYLGMILKKLGMNSGVIFITSELHDLIDYIEHVGTIIAYLERNMSPMYQEAYNLVHEQYKTEMGRFNAWFKLLPWGYTDFLRKSAFINQRRLEWYLAIEAVRVYPYVPELDPYKWAYRLMSLPPIAALIGAGLAWKLAALLPIGIHVATYGYLPVFSASFAGAWAADLATHAPYALTLSRYKSRQKEKTEGKKTRRKKNKKNKKNNIFSI